MKRACLEIKVEIGKKEYPYPNEIQIPRKGETIYIEEDNKIVLGIVTNIIYYVKWNEIRKGAYICSYNNICIKTKSKTK